MRSRLFQKIGVSIDGATVVNMAFFDDELLKKMLPYVRQSRFFARGIQSFEEVK
ncbi:hypothetical protein D3C80_2176870 [compost metagenome]